MKTLFRVIGIILWAIGLIWIVYIVGAVFSRTEGFTIISNLIGAFVFHTVCMFGGGFFIFSGVKKAAVKEGKAEPVAQAQ